MGESTNKLPRRVGWLCDGFVRYVRRFVRKNFHAVRMLDGTAPPVSEMTDGRAVIVYMNHPAWWDPMAATVLKDAVWPDRDGYAPIDADMLEKYAVFKWMGFFGVDGSDERRAGVQFLRTGQRIVEAGETVLWLTAEGEFRDVRVRPVVLQPGLAHLAARVDDAVVVPVAVEYAFWTEKTPELLVAWGEATDLGELSDEQKTVDALQERFEQDLTAAMDGLAEASMAQEAERFVDLMGGNASVGGLFGWWQRLTGRGGSHAEAMARSAAKQDKDRGAS